MESRVVIAVCVLIGKLTTVQSEVYCNMYVRTLAFVSMCAMTFLSKPASNNISQLPML